MFCVWLSQSSATVYYENNTNEHGYNCHVEELFTQLNFVHSTVHSQFVWSKWENVCFIHSMYDQVLAQMHNTMTMNQSSTEWINEMFVFYNSIENE